MTNAEHKEEDCFAHDSVSAFLDQNNRPYTVDQFKSRELFSYAMPIEDYTTLIKVEIFIKPYSDKFSFFAYVPYKIHPSRQQELLEVFATTNFDNNPIKIELNPSDGTVRCGISCYLIPDLISIKRLTQLESESLEMVKAMLPMIESLKSETS